MEVKNFRVMRRDLDADPALADELRRVGPDPAARNRWAADRGYSVTAEELHELAEGELSDEELEQVAGGWDGTGGDDGTGGGGTGGGGTGGGG